MSVLTSNEITQKINEYIEYIENSGKIYWNDGVVPTKEDWGFTNTKCGSSCTSNHFPEYGYGVQCYAFARFIAYLLTGTRLYGVDGQADGSNVGGGWIKITDLANYDFKPGDIVETTHPHTAIVLSSDGTNIQFLELLTIEKYGCKIWYGNCYNGTESYASVDYLRKTISQGGMVKHVIKCPPIEFGTPAPLPGIATSTVRLYTSNTAYTEVEYDTGSTADITAPTNRTGYRFDGWYTSVTGGTKVETYGAIPEGTTALYAHFTANTYTVTLNNNDGTNVSGSYNFTYGIFR